MFRALDPETDRLVAVKLFRLDLPPERVHQLVAELERLISIELVHPAFVSPLAAGIAGVQAYLVTEFTPADSLDIVIRDHGPAPVEHAVALAAQLAGAIDSAAVMHVSHGALHPRDVLVSSAETRVTGFGIAQALERVGVAVPLRRPYAAPERVEHQTWTREADVFSLAAICYELLMGRRVAGAGIDAAGGLTALPGVDIDLARAVFARALAVDPRNRFETALAFVEALQSAVAGAEAPDATPVAPSAPVENAAGAAATADRIDRDALEPKAKRRRAPEPPPVREPEVDLLTLAGTAPAAEMGRVGAGDLQPEADDAPLAAEDLPLHVGAAAAPREGDALTDVDLARAEAERFQDVESAPAIVPEPAAARDEPPTAPADLPLSVATPVELPRHVELPPSAPDTVARPVEHSPALSVLERSRSAMWPLVLALLVGVALGFAAGYGIGTRAPGNALPSGAAATVGRDSTEAVVPTAPREEVVAPQAIAPEGQAASVAPPSTAEAKPTGPAQPPATPGTPASSAAGTPAAPAATSPVPQASERAAATTEAGGRLLIRTSPDGARVYVDGRERGRTPLAVRDLAHGTHRVRLERDGYTTEDRRVAITARRESRSLEVALTRATAPRERATRTSGETFVGALVVDSRPSGAKVYVDGRLVGTTPFEMSGVAAGSHVVRLEHDGGYHRWSSAVRIVAGERNRVTASLEK